MEWLSACVGELSQKAMFLYAHLGLESVDALARELLDDSLQCDTDVPKAHEPQVQSFITCYAEQREAKMRAAELERSAVEAMAKTVKNAEAAPNAEEAEKISAIRAKEARLKAEGHKASVKAVKGAEEAAEAARKAEEEKAKKPAVFRTVEARPKA